MNGWDQHNSVRDCPLGAHCVSGVAPAGAPPLGGCGHRRGKLAGLSARAGLTLARGFLWLGVVRTGERVFGESCSLGGAAGGLAPLEGRVGKRLQECPHRVHPPHQLHSFVPHVKRISGTRAQWSKAFGE